MLADLDRWVFRPIVLAAMPDLNALLLGLDYGDGSCGTLRVTVGQGWEAPGVLEHHHPPEPTDLGEIDGLSLVRAMRAEVAASGSRDWRFAFQAHLVQNRRDRARNIGWQLILMPEVLGLGLVSSEGDRWRAMATVGRLDTGIFAFHAHLEIGVYDGLEAAAAAAVAWSPAADFGDSEVCACTVQRS